jgi:phosphate transport system ATP-binding protein
MEGAEKTMSTTDETTSTTIEPTMRVETHRPQMPARETLETIFKVGDLDAIYGTKTAVKGVSMDVYKNLVTAIIGPSGCGKSTFIRCFNRMNDLIPGFKQTGSITYHDADICGGNIDPVAVRRNIGMVFQRPNPFPKSIFDNVAWGCRVLGIKDNLNERVELALTRAALWDEVKDRLKASGLSLSGGQQQRLCIARTIAVEPDVVLMDEPASALDPIATQAIEQLMHELKSQFTFVIVTHNMQQAARVADMTAFFSISKGGEGERYGELIEYDATEKIFTAPSDKRTEDYVTGRFG